MKAKNFRIGNLVYDTEGKPNIVNIDALKYLLEYGETKMCQVKPIKLNEEWLINLGLKKNIYSKYYEFTTFDMTFKVDIFHQKFQGNNITIIADWGTGEVAIGAINYVHELQNLVFALTDKELELHHLGWVFKNN